MQRRNIFADLEVSRVAKKPELPPIYDESVTLLMDAHKFQCKRAGGEIDFARFFHRLAECVFLDPEFAKENPNYSPPESLKRKRRKKIK